MSDSDAVPFLQLGLAMTVKKSALIVDHCGPAPCACLTVRSCVQTNMGLHNS